MSRSAARSGQKRLWDESPAVGSSQTLRSMTIVLNRDNPVEALRAVALPWTLGGDLDFQFCACETLSKSLCAGGKTKTEKEKAGDPGFTFTPLLDC